MHAIYTHNIINVYKGGTVIFLTVFVIESTLHVNSPLETCKTSSLHIIYTFLTLGTHEQEGYCSRPVCLSVCLSVCLLSHISPLVPLLCVQHYFLCFN